MEFLLRESSVYVWEILLFSIFVAGFFFVFGYFICGEKGNPQKIETDTMYQKTSCPNNWVFLLKNNESTPKIYSLEHLELSAFMLPSVFVLASRGNNNFEIIPQENGDDEMSQFIKDLEKKQAV